MRKFEFNIKSLGNQILKENYDKVSQTTDELYINLRKLSPVDTWKYLNSHRNKWVRFEWNKIIWTIVNTDEKAEKIETGWRKSPVNWNRKLNWDNFYSVWAKVYELALKRIEDRFYNKLK